MAEKAGDVIKDALMEITVLGAEAPVEATDAQSAIRYLNRMMATLDAKGVSLGYTEVTNFASDITVPAGAVEGMIFLLATRLWTQYNQGEPVPGSLIASAKAGVKAMLALAVVPGQTEFPSTLPVGSGNEGDATFRSGHFYEDLQDDILAEANGSIGLEESTT